MNILPAAYQYQPVFSSAVTPAYSGISNVNPTGKPNQDSAADAQPDDKISGSQKNTPSGDNTQKSSANSTEETVNGRALDQNDLRLLEELKNTDTEVRQHEMAHIAAGGKYITSGANFTYQKGPDGQSYAVAGEVGIDTSPVPGDPEATLQKMRQVKNAALAPASPSSQDRKVAANATSQVSKALSELMMLQVKEQAENNETRAFGGLQKAADSYTKVNTLPEIDTSSFEIAI